MHCLKFLNSCYKHLLLFSSRESRGEILRILELDPIPGLLIIVLVNHLNLHFLSSLHDTDLVAVTEEGDEIRHAWYQWVVFVLFFQVLF